MWPSQATHTHAEIHTRSDTKFVTLSSLAVAVAADGFVPQAVGQLPSLLLLLLLHVGYSYSCLMV